MAKIKLSFSVNGIRTESVVVANNVTEARKLIEVQYPNCKVYFYYTQVLQ